MRFSKISHRVLHTSVFFFLTAVGFMHCGKAPIMEEKITDENYESQQFGGGCRNKKKAVNELIQLAEHHINLTFEQTNVLLNRQVCRIDLTASRILFDQLRASNRIAMNTTGDVLCGENCKSNGMKLSSNCTVTIQCERR